MVDVAVKLPYRESRDSGSSQAGDILVSGTPRRFQGKRPSR